MTELADAAQADAGIVLTAAGVALELMLQPIEGGRPAAHPGG